MKDMVTLAITLTIAVLALAPLVTAEVPQMINYQGRLTDSLGTPVSGSYNILFTICDHASGEATFMAGAQGTWSIPTQDSS